MNDFLLEYYKNITFILEFLAAVVGVILYKKYTNTAAKFFIWFLVYLTICDFTSRYVHCIEDGPLSFLEGTRLIRNFWWSTLFWKIGAILFFGFYFCKILTNNLFKVIIKYSTYVFLLFSIIYILLNWEAYFVRFFPIISILGAIIVFLCCVLYFIEILQSDKILTFYYSLNFYISSAIFIWWLIITPIVFYDIYMSHKDWNFIFVKWQIYLFANTFMYLTFTFALLWCKPEQTTRKEKSI